MEDIPLIKAFPFLREEKACSNLFLAQPPSSFAGCDENKEALSCFLVPDNFPEEKAEDSGQQVHLSLCHPELISEEKQLRAASCAKQIMQKTCALQYVAHKPWTALSQLNPRPYSRLVHKAVLTLKSLASWHAKSLL